MDKRQQRADPVTAASRHEQQWARREAGSC